MPSCPQAPSPTCCPKSCKRAGSASATGCGERFPLLANLLPLNVRCPPYGPPPPPPVCIFAPRRKCSSKNCIGPPPPPPPARKPLPPVLFNQKFGSALDPPVECVPRTVTTLNVAKISCARGLPRLPAILSLVCTGFCPPKNTGPSAPIPSLPTVSPPKKGATNFHNEPAETHSASKCRGANDDLLPAPNRP